MLIVEITLEIGMYYRCDVSWSIQMRIRFCNALPWGGGSEWKNLPLMDSLPTIRSLIWSLQCDVKSARLMRLKLGHISSHTETEGYACVREK